MTTPYELGQHIGWLKMYAEDMNERNWKDMRARIINQIRSMQDDLTQPVDLVALEAAREIVALPSDQPEGRLKAMVQCIVLEAIRRAVPTPPVSSQTNYPTTP